jgi:hypothetical protein
MARPKLENDLGGLQVVVEQLPPRAGMRAAIAAARVFGPTIVELLTAGPLTIGRYRLPMTDLLQVLAGRSVAALEADGETWKAATLSLETHPELAGAYEFLARRIMSALETITPDAVAQLCDDMLIGHTLITVGAEQRRVTTEALLDAMVPDAMTLFGILRMALELNLRPFVLVLATLAGSSPGQT